MEPQCLDCEHDFDDHSNIGCNITSCPCTETPTNLMDEENPT